MRPEAARERDLHRRVTPFSACRLRPGSIMQKNTHESLKLEMLTGICHIRHAYYMRLLPLLQD